MYSCLLVLYVFSHPGCPLIQTLGLYIPSRLGRLVPVCFVQGELDRGVHVVDVLHEFL